eukprot:CAMPEP_0197703252 /NCGR_PEP_ID=MMETSP1338-20131121/125343_1 /TAXON_ID=43686 ORGANISM="Pelagodinium beii, Strain RCC1491" /NCGR_SAMPLE_ID=MMETSP1338 /ASSEMBLY_ACC=CAM_ASM_000754 /LENGTH=654 /DNA_ID=CAMNT_0043287145 /DNA_START=73 /DNA_END=2038 /DNA_ORIENTATION=-
MFRIILLAAVLCVTQGRLHKPNKVPSLLKADEAFSETSPPMFTKETMPEVSPTLKCVLNLTLQYFVIYTALFIVRTVNQLREEKMTGLQQMLETACTTVTYAPMLSVLFVGTRMRAIQLAQGQTEKYGLPQWWVQDAMYSCSCAVFAQVVLVMLIPVVTGDVAAKTDEDGNLDMSGSAAGGVVAATLSALRYLIMLGLYGGFTAVIIGCFMMEGPEEIWHDLIMLGLYGGFTAVIIGCFMMEGPEEIWHGNQPPVSPALFSTILCTATFFSVYLLVAITKTAVELRGNSEFLEKMGSVLTLAKFTVNFAPMLSILFIGARIRALQMDPKNGNPQRWAQLCFYLCTASLIVQTGMVVLMPLVLKCEVKKGSCEGDVEFKVENDGVGAFLIALRYLALLSMYGGFTAVVASVFLITHPTDPALTPPLSTAMLCTMNLSVQFFGVYLGLFICNTVKQYMQSSTVDKLMMIFEAGQKTVMFAPMLSILFWATRMHAELNVDKLMMIFEAGQKTVMFAPMLSILFWATRMRALQLAKAEDGTIPPTAGPPVWAQDCMYLCTWSVLIQLVLAMVVAALGDEKVEMDENGTVKPPQNANKVMVSIFEAIRYFSLLSMYGGSCAVMTSMFLMTPENIPPYSHQVGMVPPPPSVPTATTKALF